MFTITTAGVGAETPLGRLRARALAQPDIRTRGFLVDARGAGIRALLLEVPSDVPVDDYDAAKKANPLSLITSRWLREQREAVYELHYRRFHRNEWTSRIGSWLPAGAWQTCANGRRPETGCPVWAGVDVGGARADSACVWVSRLGNDHYAVDSAIYSGEDGIVGVNETLLKLAERHQLREVVYDPWRAAMLVRGLEQRGIRCTVFQQSDSRMIPASAALHRAIVEGRIHHPDDEQLNAHVAAAVAKHGRRGWRVDQAERGANIDGLVALVMAYEAATAPPPPRGEVLGVV
jgi:phage terminase large subunit-like protein